MAESARQHQVSEPERQRLREEAILEVRFPGPGPRSAIGELARSLVRDIERLAANAVDPGLSEVERSVARGLLIVALPPSSLELERLRQVRQKKVNQLAKARSGKTELSDAEVQRLLERLGTDDDGAPRKVRDIHRNLRDLHITVDRGRLGQLRNARPK